MLGTLTSTRAIAVTGKRFLKMGRKRRKHLTYFEPDDWDQQLAKENPKEHDKKDFQKIIDREVNRLGNVFTEELWEDGVEAKGKTTEARGDQRLTREQREEKSKKEHIRNKKESKMQLGDNITAQKLRDLKKEQIADRKEKASLLMQRNIDSVVRHSLQQRDIVPTVMTFRQLGWVPDLATNPDHFIQVDLVAVGFELVGVVVPQHCRSVTLWYTYNPRCEVKGGVEVMNKVLEYFTGPIRALIAHTLQSKRAPDVYFKMQDDPTKALKYSERFQQIRNGESVETLHAFSDYKPELFVEDKTVSEDVFAEVRAMKIEQKRQKMVEEERPRKEILGQLFDDGLGDVLQVYPSTEDLELVSFED